MLAILCQLMRTIPSNYCIVEELFFGEWLKLVEQKNRTTHFTFITGDCPIARNVEELWRLLQHADTRIKSRAIRLLAYLSVNSSKTGDQFIKHNALKLWKCIQSALQSEVSELREVTLMNQDLLLHHFFTSKITSFYFLLNIGSQIRFQKH